MGKIPVFVLSGFLGSGKTTLLERLLEACTSRKWNAAVLMNEIGKTDTDGIFLEGKSNRIEKLLDGCICCNKKGEVVQSMEKLLALKPDIIFVELTGVANPEEVADSLTEPQLIDQVSLQQVVTLIDAENILSYNNIFESDRELVRTTRKQIEVADHLIVNKTDLVSEKDRQKVEKLLRKNNPVAAITYTTYSNVEVAPLLERDEAKGKTRQITVRKEPGHTHANSFTRIRSITIPLPAKTTEKKIESYLKKWKGSLLRAKGYVPLADGTYIMQHVMKRTQWEPTAAKQQGEHYLVLIGLDLKEAEMKEELALLK